MYGAIAVGAIYLYNRYTKKEKPLGEEPQGGGGGGGGGFFPPMPPTPPIPPIVGPPKPPVWTTRSIVEQPVTTEMLRNQQAANTGATATNTGITGIGMGTGTATTTGTGAGSYMTTSQGGNVLTPFKPFDGYSFNGGLSLDQIRRSWNRP